MSAPIHIYTLKLNLQSSANQPELIELFKNQGDDVIQISDGLCIRSRFTIDEMKKVLKEKNFDSGAQLQSVDPSDETLSKDVQNFISQV